jgi:hypothetical protein
MIAIDPPVRILFEALASEGPSTHESEPFFHAETHPSTPRALHAADRALTAHL